ncbi:MAG: hypothetical protein ABI345_08210 [Jatrophihabitans sp.]
MATLERIDPAYTAWTPSAAGLATEEETYVGRHRGRSRTRGFSLTRMFYSARHRIR